MSIKSNLRKIFLFMIIFDNNNLVDKKSHLFFK